MRMGTAGANRYLGAVTAVAMAVQLGLAGPALAAGPGAEATPEAGAKPGESSLFAIRHPLFGDADDVRSDVWAPLLSLAIPGADQWYLGQTYPAMFYTGLAIGGIAYAEATARANDTAYATQLLKDKYARAGKKYEPNALDAKDIAERKITLGGLLEQDEAGLMSLYHAFRSSVRTRKAHGQYGFLAYEETPQEIFLAPFHFEFLARPTTFIPLLVGASLVWLQMKFPADTMTRDKFTSADATFTAAYSYSAGTGEEAAFRGWLMPVLREYTGSDFWSNASQSVVFAAAHLNNVSFPIAQLGLGYDLGYVSQRNNWRLAEGVFIHTWWDVMAFAAQYEYKMKEPDQLKAAAIHPVLWLPPFQYFF